MRPFTISQSAQIESLMSRCVAVWVDRTGMGHTFVGRLLLGHTVRVESLLGGWWGRQVILRTASWGRVSRFVGQAPPPD